MTVFTEAEMKRRFDSLRAEMARRRVDAALLTSVPSVAYYSGRPPPPHRGTCAVVVTSVDHDLVSGDFLPAIGRILRRGSDTISVVGIDDESLPLAMRQRIQDALPHVLLVDMSRPLERLQQVRSPEEVEVLRVSARISALVGQTVATAIHDGASELDVTHAGIGVMLQQMAQQVRNGEQGHAWTSFRSGINTSYDQAWPTTRRIGNGDILSFSCFPTVAGYGAAVRRTLFLGEPDSRALQVWAINLNARRHALELIRPGATCRKIEQELDEMYAERDLRHLSVRRRRIGLLAHPYGPRTDREMVRDSDTAFEPGMLVSLCPTVTVAQHEPEASTYGEADVLLVNETGAELLTALPAGPEHNILMV